MKDFYQILGVEKTATQAQLRSAYHKLALKHHPDRNGGSEESEEKFREIGAAYNCLSDERLRKLYDHERSRPAHELGAVVRAQAPDRDLRQEENPLTALETARAWARARGGVVVVTGSIFLVAQVRAAWLGDQVDPVDPGRSGDPMP